MNLEYTNSQIAALIDEHIHSQRDRAILKRRLIDGICYEPLAEEFDLSVPTCRCRRSSGSSTKGRTGSFGICSRQN